MKFPILPLGLILAGAFVSGTPNASAQENLTPPKMQPQTFTSFRPGELWPDNNGVHINAHGGGILLHNGVYYWFGEHKTEGDEGNRAQVGVHVYSSRDLYNWKDEGVALSVIEDDASEIAKGSIIERPKVVYNAKTGKFVMWFHLELKGQGYAAARAGMAVADNVTGPFTYVRSYRPNKGIWPIDITEELKVTPNPEPELSGPAVAISGRYLRRDFETGQMSRDMTIFMDDDQKAYLITSAEENFTMHVHELTDDFQDFTGKWMRLHPGGWSEAPTIFKKGEKYYSIMSGNSGWAPNRARSYVSDSMWGPWKSLGDPSRGTPQETGITFESQSTHVLPVAGQKDAFIFMGDRWRPKNAIDGRYVWLPIEWEHEKPVMRWHEQWDLSFFDADKVAARAAVLPAKGLEPQVTVTSSYPAYGNNTVEMAGDWNDATMFWIEGFPKADVLATWTFAEPVAVKSVSLASGERDGTKDQLVGGELEISEDGTNFRRVAGFINGSASADLPANTKIKAIRVKGTETQKTWVMLRDPVLR